MPGDCCHVGSTIQAARGRGAGLNPGNRFESLRLHVLGDELDDRLREHPRGVQLPTMVFHDRAQRVINRVDSPDLGFNWTLNPYRGCEHGCVYCYARPTHETLGFSCGLDFETKIVVKQNAPELLRRELASPRWLGEPIVMSGVTDCYQPLEAKLKITRRCLEVFADCRQPVSIVTKNRLVVRDLDLLASLAGYGAVSVAISLTTLDAKLAGAMEPRTSRPADRLRAMRELAEAGIPVAAMLAPIIPGLNDREIPHLLKAAAQAGATSAGWIMLRLPHQVKALFLDWLARHLPHQAPRIERLIREMRGGELYEATPTLRMRGRGPLAEQIAATFKVFTKRNKLDRKSQPLSSTAFRRPTLDSQMTLFDH
ncbi:MAG: PA0069 family radical SAM protein [Planctomycetota bacterium]|nr:PA0069 family radical SAM protein [Planctomycetota bacterium]